jgi:aminoglycoside 3-N-acetyltransferase
MSNYISYDKIMDHLDINEEDVLLIASDLTLLAFESMKNGEIFDPNVFIDSIIKKIGTNGSLLFPTFNWGFCSGKVFDYKRTISKTGALTNTALKRSDFIRTQHPIYSFAVWGKDKEKLFQMDNRSAFGADSPFAYLYENKAKMLIIGLNYQDSFTFAHHVEEMEKVSYRYMKDFTSHYIDCKGNKSLRTYSMFVRDLEKGVETCLNPIGEKLEKKGASIHKKINGVDFYLIYLAEAFKVIQEDILFNGARNLYTINKNV